MLSPNLFLRKIRDETKIPTVSVQKLSTVKLFPDVEDQWDLREKLGSPTTSFTNAKENPPDTEWPHDCLEALETDARSKHQIFIRKIGEPLGGPNGIYRLSWGSSARLIQYSPPDDAFLVWDRELKAIGFSTQTFIHQGEIKEFKEWATGDLNLFVTLDATRQWQKAHINLSTTLWGDTDRAQALENILFAQANWTDANFDVAAAQFESGKKQLANYCVVPRTASSIIELEIPINEDGVQKICALIGLDRDTTEAFKKRWRASVERGMEGAVLGGQLTDVAIEFEFGATPERGKAKAQWTFDATMHRKDVGRAAMRQYQHSLADRREAVVDQGALQTIIEKLIQRVEQLNSEDIWSIAEHRLRQLHDDLGIPYEE